LPVKVFDYLAAGLPVLIKGLKKGALREFYEKNLFTGFYVGTWADFQNILKQAVKNISKIKRKNKKRRELIEKAYNRYIFLKKQSLA